MLVVLHIDAKDWSRLLGMWRAPSGSDGFPESYYPDPADGFEIGRGRMEVKGPAPLWTEFFWDLQMASPYSAYWPTQEIEDAPLADVFEEWRANVAASADHLAKSKPPSGYSIVVPGVTVSPFDLAELVGGPTGPFDTHDRLSTLCWVLRR